MTEATSAQVTDSVRRVLAPNAGPMTLAGTNTYVISAPDAATAVVVDPGPLDEAHLARLTATPVELVLLTHWHADHSDAAEEFGRRVGAPVRAFSPTFCLGGGTPLENCEVIEAAGVRIEVLETPGHTMDSACFIVHEASGPVALTGDTVLGASSTVIAPPDGHVGSYLATVAALAAFARAEAPVVPALPGHGPVIDDLAAACDAVLAHREARLQEISAALDELGLDADGLSPAGFAFVAERVYGEVPEALQHAAQNSLRAQLSYLRGR
ncbi:MAG TPA: MBL fold metallo-hydrolase [Candidatus Lumbricidophila sp.]|nr:MBL fold metallo-hydrolase [Candidatus Lumbricidophila sp.]